jgi:hypothetical protein
MDGGNMGWSPRCCKKVAANVATTGDRGCTED